MLFLKVKKYKAEKKAEQLYYLASEIFDARGIFGDNSETYEVCKFGNRFKWLRGAFIEHPLSSPRAIEIEKKLFLEHLIEVIKRNRDEKLNLDDVEIVSFALLRYRCYDGEDERQYIGDDKYHRLKFVPLIISLSLYLDAIPDELYDELRTKYNRCKLARESIKFFAQ